MNKEIDQQNSLSSLGWLEASNDTNRSSDQKTLTDNTSECSTETKESSGWGPQNVNRKTNWPTSGPGENGEGLVLILKGVARHQILILIVGNRCQMTIQ